MAETKEAIVVVNCGSSSVKLDVFDGQAKENPMSASVERVGTKDAIVKVDVGGKKTERALSTSGKPEDTGHDDAVAALLDEVTKGGFVPRAVGHRVVHGGDKFSRSVVIDKEVLAEIERCVPLAPLHNPANLKGIEAVTTRLPTVPQVAVFDTAFHSTLPPEAYLYAIPRRFHVEQRVRRYGFHGTSHAWVAERAASFFARPVESLRLVTLHLGNGCSACAIDGGKSVDTTMGMTPLEGLMMGTRSGDVDPAVVLRLARELGIDQAEQLLNKESGLLGVSGLSHDMRDLVKAADAGNVDADLAIRMFARRVRKTVGALACAMGGVDGMVFTGGIGEHSARVRAAVCDGLRVIGALLHERKNNASSTAERDLSTMDSRVRILVIPTDEERAIARDVARLLDAPVVAAAS
ncbi:MAG: acetate kinase [Deltaproteobacteria bacterium]|nr:acetate kinase [Deltaproteobacteria bacterium]